MKLSLKNIGKIETASVEINGITVIAGENNTGKSTVGRALFAVFNFSNQRCPSACSHSTYFRRP
ncbi:AAA family ATPase, partial [Eisenbergiella massiliensis]|uniref:AAA family ATPase n=1 Tax=Eisenbergiella massiliensis TaxID=1720294 RepID=UPI0023F02647